jgi:MFS transporter, YNFM family, putative membrane transport protein
MSQADAALRLKAAGTPIIIGVIGFLTLVDLFAAQAILPSLAERFGAAPAEIGFAVNASTIGMALAGLGVVFFGGAVDRRIGVVASLALLSLPTFALSLVPDLSAFTALRIVQGVFMVTAFSLTMSYLAERCTAAQSTTALAAYVTGVVASNLVGRLVAATVTGELGVPANFVLFAALNLAGAALAYFVLRAAKPMGSSLEPLRAPATVIRDHLSNACLRTSFAIGFLILFAFIGVFTYVNFVLAAPPLGLSAMALGLVYFVFLPSMATTPLAGAVATRIGARRSFLFSLGLAIAALPLLLVSALPAVIAGLAIVGVGTFFAQATATGFVGRAAKRDRAAASGLYLASYYLGGLAGAALVGKVFERYGWTSSVMVIGAALSVAAALAAMLKRSTAEPATAASV